MEEMEENFEKHLKEVSTNAWFKWDKNCDAKIDLAEFNKRNKGFSDSYFYTISSIITSVIFGEFLFINSIFSFSSSIQWIGINI